MRVCSSRYFATRLGHLVEVARASCGIGRTKLAPAASSAGEGVENEDEKKNEKISEVGGAGI